MDPITGTEGDDTIVQGDRPGVRILSLGGDDKIELDLEGDAGGLNFVDAGDGDDLVINAHEDGNEIVLGRGDDIYVGRGFAFSVERSDTVRGGAGNDTIAVATNKSLYFGDAGDDLLVSEGHSNGFDGGTGADTISYELRDDSTVVGGTGVSIDLAQGFALTGNTTSEDLISIENAIGTGVRDEIFGSATANILIGRGGDDQLVGRAGGDRLDGGLGADEMIGGQGNDIYVVDNVNDVVDELNDGGSGIDTVEASISFSLVASSRLGGNVENLTLTGAASINATGNALANKLVGNAGNNTLRGGLGNDTYFVQNIGDVVIELAGQGTDLVRSSVTFNGSVANAVGIENITLTGSAAINAAGNALNNTITGNDANNGLNGGKGADALIGGLGNDTYTIDSTGDVITELAGQGTDTVKSAISFTLSDTLENLTLASTKAINGIGNAGVNVIIGGDGDNILSGKGGADMLTGGAGSDTFDYNAVSESSFAAFDRILDLRNNDRIDLAGIDADTTTAGNQAFNLVSAFSNRAGQLTLTYNVAKDFTVLAADVNGDGIADMRIVINGDHRDFTNFAF